MMGSKLPKLIERHQTDAPSQLSEGINFAGTLIKLLAFRL